jgi:hypothetical protein
MKRSNKFNYLVKNNYNHKPHIFLKVNGFWGYLYPCNFEEISFSNLIKMNSYINKLNRVSLKQKRKEARKNIMGWATPELITRANP